jgi:hypothetical protein
LNPSQIGVVPPRDNSNGNAALAHIVGRIKSTELVNRYGTGSPDRGEEFLCPEFLLMDHLGTRRTFLYLTGARRNFVKIRVTLGANDAADARARHLADAVTERLWPTFSGPRSRSTSTAASL